MPDEWQVAGRKGRSRSVPSPVQPELLAIANADHSHTPHWTYRSGSANIHLPSASPALNDAALVRLQQQIANRAEEVSSSSFLQGFRRLLKYVEHQEILSSALVHSSVQETFHWSTATELVVYGLGSPAAGKDHNLVVILSGLASCAAPC